MHQMILVMDDPVPEHIQQTFKLSRNGYGWSTDLPGWSMLMLGEEIDLQAEGYTIIHADNSWHAMKAANIFVQLRELRKDALVMLLPVEVEKEEDPFVFRNTFPVPRLP